MSLSLSPIRFFAYDPAKRVSAETGLEHEYFQESPLPVDPSMFPTWPARSEQNKKHSSSPKPPSGGKAYQKLLVSLGLWISMIGLVNPWRDTFFYFFIQFLFVFLAIITFVYYFILK